MPFSNGYRGNYNHTRLGAVVTNLCDDGFFLPAITNSTCTNDGLWLPVPECIPIGKNYCGFWFLQVFLKVTIYIIYSIC